MNAKTKAFLAEEAKKSLGNSNVSVFFFDHLQGWVIRKSNKIIFVPESAAPGWFDIYSPLHDKYGHWTVEEYISMILAHDLKALVLEDLNP